MVIAVLDQDAVIFALNMLFASARSPSIQTKVLVHTCWVLSRPLFNQATITCASFSNWSLENLTTGLIQSSLLSWGTT
jgi:hypothetical protein